MVVSDLSYLGSDIAGTYNLWNDEKNFAEPVLQAAFANVPARPGVVKRVLEEALIDAAIPFLFYSRPVTLLRDGGIAGAVLATRTSLMAVTCRGIVDASENGIVARLAGVDLEPRTDRPSEVRWNVIAAEPPANWPGLVREIHPAFVQEDSKDGPQTYRAFQLSIDRAALGDDPAAAVHAARALLVDEKVMSPADWLIDVPAHTLPSASPRARLSDLDGADAEACPGLWLLNGLLPVTTAALADFQKPEQLAALGRKIGAAAGLAKTAKASSFTVRTHDSATGDYHFAPVFLRGESSRLDLPALAFPTLGKFDVVVAGGGTGGAPAGIAAARSGAKALVLEIQSGLGGVGTRGLICSYWFGNKVGFTSELDTEVSKFDTRSRSKRGNMWSPEVKSSIYHRMLQEAGGRAWMGSFAFGVRLDGGKADGLLVSTPFGCGLVEAGCVVDATGSADVAAAAGAPCRVIDANHVAVQGTGLSPRVNPDVRHQNSDHTFVDEADPIGVTSAYVHARAKYPNHFDTTTLVNSRERRQIIGEIEISPLDLLAERTFPDTVFTASSNFDTHGFTVHPVFMAAVPNHKALHAHVPFRCMLPRGVEGILVTGLGMSAHRDALPVIRMQADVQNQGYVAGLAAAESAEKGVTLRQLDLRALQGRLVALGILAPDVPQHGDSFPMSAESVQEAAGGDLHTLMNAAILLAHPAASRQPLLEVMEKDPDENRRHQAALLLGLMGEKAAAPVLIEAIRASDWDEGWDYKGMDQFGASMSPLDAKIIALARTGDNEGIEAIEEKILALDGNARFSHCRSVSIASSALAHPRLLKALAGLLEKPSIRGHAWLDLQTMRATANDNLVETESRNLALRELHLARGLFLAGDEGGRGREILETYSHDLRGHFARHAAAVLANGESSRFEVA